MGLMADAAQAQGQNFIRGNGRTYGRIARVDYQEPTAKEPKTRFKVHVVIAKSTSPNHSHQVGQTGLAQLNFRYPEKDLPVMQRAIRNAALVKFGAENELELAFKALTEASLLDDKVAAKSASDAAVKRIEAEMTRLCGEDQPLLGTPITVVSKEVSKVKSEGTYTVLDFEIPTEADLA